MHEHHSHTEATWTVHCELVVIDFPGEAGNGPSPGCIWVRPVDHPAPAHSPTDVCMTAGIRHNSMVLAFDTDEAARSRALWANKALSNVLVVFSTDPAQITRAVRQHAEMQNNLILVSNALGAGSTGALNTDSSWHRSYGSIPPMEWPTPEEGCVVLAAHQDKLFMCAEYFRRQMEGEASLHQPMFLRQQLAGSSRMVEQRVVVVGVEQQEQLEVAETLLRLMYQHDIFSEPEQRDPNRLLQLCLLADRLQAHACLQAVADALAALQPSDLPLTFISRFLCVTDRITLCASAPQLKETLMKGCGLHLGQLLGPPAIAQPISRDLGSQLMALAELPPHEQHSHLVANALARMLAADGFQQQQQRLLAARNKLSASVMYFLGNAERLVHNVKWLGFFCAMPFEVLHHWVSSDRLQTLSENTVLWLLQSWRTSQLLRAPAIDAMAALESRMAAVAAHVRVRHLSPAYQHLLLTDQLPWFRPRSHLLHLISLLRVTPPGADLGLGPQFLNQTDQLPRAWWALGPRRSPPGMHPGLPHVLTLDVSKEQIDSALASATPVDAFVGPTQFVKVLACIRTVCMLGACLHACVDFTLMQVSLKCVLVSQ